MNVLRIVTTAAVAVATALVPAVAQAGGGVSTVASGLNNPRGLAFSPDGALYVAEAGTGGEGPCMAGPEGGTVCFGTSGSITVIDHGKQSRLISGLPSIANSPDGSQAIGPSDVSFQGKGGMYFTVGLGANPAVRASLPGEAPQQSGWLLRGKQARQVADIAGYEATANPDGGEPDSNPNSVLALPGGQVVADAGGNDLLWVAANGKISTLAVFPDVLVDAPPFLGLPPGTKIPMQAVPTSVVRGPDGALYVGQLTGFPFPEGAAKVYRIVPGHAPEVYAAGFTNIIDLGFSDDGKLYVLEIAQKGLLSGDQTGALIKVSRGNQQVIMSEGLVAPGGLTFHGNAAYVSNCSVCAGGGSVLRIPLH
ncbi:MAG TPA: ScyD/ScyE family protein [Amycolatopsis sp.]|nr:ScyD/ScyE family protein [Amycolatopsis sp.]